MKTTYIYQALVLISLSMVFFISCSEGSFTKIVDVNLEKEDKQLAVVARMNTAEDDQLILVSETLSVLENSDNFSSLSDAKINITTPDKGIIEPDFNTNLNLYSLSGYSFQEGENYSISIDHPDYAPMTASIKVPSAPELISVEADLHEGDIFNINPDVITVKFKDPIGESNSYLFEGFVTYIDEVTGDTFTDNYNFEISENILEYNDEVITDITFDGKEYELALLGSRSFYSDVSSPYSITIQLTSISEEFLLYENSIDQAYDSNDNPFVEPSTIYTNFDNGFGIFTVDVTQSLEVIL